MKKKKKVFRMISAVLASVGFGILVYTLFPFAVSYSEAKQFYPELVSPLSAENIYDDVDYTDANNWFPTKSAEFNPSSIRYYTISIPRLGIEDATVLIGGEDLSESLIQFPGTVMPGKTGNTVIFGHSILPIYYDPTDYMAIFSTLSALRDGDPIYIKYDGINYTYRVFDKFEVLPTALEVLDQNSSGSFLSLITCSPPGDPRKPRRLIVKAEIDTSSYR